MRVQYSWPADSGRPLCFHATRLKSEARNWEFDGNPKLEIRTEARTIPVRSGLGPWHGVRISPASAAVDALRTGTVRAPTSFQISDFGIRASAFLLAFLALLLGAFLLPGCRSPGSVTGLQRFEFQSPHMGTLFTITLYAPDPLAATNAARAAFARIAALDRTMTDYDPESELMRLCQRPAGVPSRVSADLFDVLQKAQHFARISDGAFDFTVGPYVRLWRRARRTAVLPPAEALARAAQAVGYQKVRLDARDRTVTLLAPHMQLDLGGIGKGYAADQALAVLRRHGITRALVAASGDIAVGDAPPGRPGWRVGIGEVDAPSRQLGTQLLLRHAAVSTSGDTEQFVEIHSVRYSHIINPRTGLALTNRIQATIVAPNATTTEGLSKPVCVLGVPAGLAFADRFPRAAALVAVKEDGRLVLHPSRRFAKIPQER